MDAEVVAHIDARLDAVIRDHGVSLPLCVESGSRAWGFPSPDSDYDCRFIYVRRQDQYLALWPSRDVIETPLDAVLDVNGWDIAKALRLMVKGNAVIIEWLTSPIVYRADPEFRSELLAMAQQIVPRPAVARHYRSLLRHQLKLLEGVDAPIKKLFYALRPAMALRWLRRHPAERVAPMHFPTLVAETGLDTDLACRIEDLLRQKAITRELGRAPFDPIFHAFVQDEDRHAEAVCGEANEEAMATAQDTANTFFLQAISRHGPK